MKTFIAWLIANVWEFVTVCAIIAFEVWIFAFPVELPVNDRISCAIFGALLIAIGRGLAGGMPASTVTVNIVNLIVLAIIVIIAFCLLKSTSAGESFHNYAFLYLMGCLGAFLFAVVAAIFTYCNMNEVVSRRMFFVNSHALLFSITLRYVFDRFVAVWSSLSYLVLLALVIWG